ncbi:MAG: hypothetical protein SFW67_28535 [Myxococcaceae bacterium]|nr:hypothetical protein [Myxococcaceae bacterium]
MTRLALLMVALAAGDWTPTSRIRESGPARVRGREGVSLAFFEAFPSSGAGTTGVCSTTAPTGAKGEALTFTRASTAICTKTASGGLATTGIANGDLVSVSSNVIRQEYDANGVLGVRVEESRTNDVLRSQELNNAAWLTSAVGVAGPTITADAAVAPDGTTTAERFEVPAVAGGQESVRYQTLGSIGSTRATSIYVKGNGSSGSIQVIHFGPGGACTVCAYNSTTWTRCVYAGVTGGAGNVGFGSSATAGGCGLGAANGAIDAFIWQAQGELGAFATSPIPTTSASVTRSAEDARFVLSAITVTAPWSAAATTWLPAGIASNARVGGAGGTTGLVTALFDTYVSGGVLQVFSSQVTPNNYSTGLAVTASTSARYAAYHDGTLWNGCVNSTCAAGASRAWSSLANTTTFAIGQYATAGAINGIQSRFCFQPGDATRCR